MKLLRRILVVVAIIIVFVLLGLWMTPVALSYYSAHQALPITRVVPIELRDKSIFDGAGRSMSFFGYQFEIPWTDSDETQTKLYPTNAPYRADLHFHSGLRVIITAVRPREWVDGLAEQAKVPSDKIEAAFGRSNYEVVRTIYEFSPERMHHWTFAALPREQFLLILKSLAPLKSAESGIFNIQNTGFRGFQQGNPQVRPDVIALDLFAESGSIEFIVSQKDHALSSRVTQPELNRIIHSARKLPPKLSATISN